MKRHLLHIGGALVAVVAIVFGVYVFNSQPAASPSQNVVDDSTSQSDSVSADSADQEVAAQGRYVAYEADLVGDERYDQTMLFFYAPWCPECKAFDGELSNSEIPDGIQVLRVDYDSAGDLRKKYGVTTQTTFVRVDADGAKQALWVGYGRTKSIDAVVENLS